MKFFWARLYNMPQRSLRRTLQRRVRCSSAPRITLQCNSLFLLCCTAAATLVCSCKYHRNKAHPEVTTASITSGERLAKKYCQSCHQLPDPAHLDAKTWEHGVLPAMGPRLGIYFYGFERYPYQKYEANIGDNFYPKEPVISYSQWQNIIDYYTATSPDSLVNHNVAPIEVADIPGFSIISPAKSYANSSTALLQIIQGSQTNLLVSNATTQQLFLFNSSLAIIDSQNVQGPLVDVFKNKGGWQACNIGFMNPNNGSFGKLHLLNVSDSGAQLAGDSFINSLQRPVAITSADLTNNGKDDYIICEFGFLTGALSWYEKLGNQKFSKHILHAQPGAIKAYTNDYNHDGRPDVWALVSQGDEGVFLFTNKGQGQFETRKLLHFPPSYGSSYFELVDFDKDGDDDIVYTCGDNADYSQILKPYHGVYVFLNDGRNNFIEKYFFALNGCYKAIARDFDGDGDIDIATISFFADYKNRPEEGFVYLRNDGNWKFKAISPLQTQQGRWLTMTAGDVNNDGTTDIVLGNFAVAPTFIASKHDFTKVPPILVLLNKPQ